MMPVFVTATGTDLGKTYVLCGILRQLRARGVAFRVVKPVLSGFDPAAPDSSDSGRLLAAAGLPVTAATLDAITPWRFAPPLSPDMAARRAEVTIGLPDVFAFCTRPVPADTLVLVEGAGGIMSPLGSDFLNIDLAQRLQARIVLVAGGYLGTISHTLTAVVALKARGLSPAAVVLSGVQAGPVNLEETRDSLVRHLDVPVLCVERDAAVPAALATLVTA
jgi:dethiobiotin synthetase